MDPGGNLTYTPLSVAASRYMNIRDIDYVFASHQDPDIIGAIDRWIVHTRAKIVTSRLWARFLPHLVSGYVTQQLSGSVYDRIISMPDGGINVPFGETFIQCLPAHFMHSVSNRYCTAPARSPCPGTACRTPRPVPVAGPVFRPVPCPGAP